MHPSLEFILGLLDRHVPARIAAEDLAGPHGQALKLWQRLGLLETTPEPHPTPSCPHCKVGVPFPVSDRFLCSVCLGSIGRQHLLLWRFNLDAFLRWLARQWKLQGGVRQLDERLWQLGSAVDRSTTTEVFFYRSGPLSEGAAQRLGSFHRAILVRALPGACVSGFSGPCVSLLELLQQDRCALRVGDPQSLIRQETAVRFDERSGTLSAGAKALGVLPLGSREYHLIACLAKHLDTFVPYADLKKEVLHRSGGSDDTDEASYCQKLKNRIKKRGWVPLIDTLILTTNKGNGYRLRGQLEEW